MLKATGATHKGAVRPQNQDAFRCRVLGEKQGYAIVCDGMGGEKAGDVASTAAIEIVDRSLKRGLAPGMGANSVRSLILSSVSAANAVVFEQAQRSAAYSGMGTTLALALVSEGTLHICHVGDSRIYRIENGGARQLTHDHSMVQMLVDKGELSPNEADSHPKRHFITKAVGVEPRIDPDYTEYPFGIGQLLLLCSDGLSNYLRAESMAQEVLACAAASSVDRLIEYALRRGGADNITAVLMAMD